MSENYRYNNHKINLTAFLTKIAYNIRHCFCHHSSLTWRHCRER